MQVSEATITASMEALTVINVFTQRMKNNTEESNAIAKYASNLTYQLFVALQLPGNQDRSSNIVAFVKVLQDIAAFTKERAERSELKGSLSEQREAGDIKKWEERLGRAYERFNIPTLLSIDDRAGDFPDPRSRSLVQTNRE